MVAVPFLAASAPAAPVDTPAQTLPPPPIHPQQTAAQGAISRAAPSAFLAHPPSLAPLAVTVALLLMEEQGPQAMGVDPFLAASAPAAPVDTPPPSTPPPQQTAAQAVTLRAAPSAFLAPLPSPALLAAKGALLLLEAMA